MAKILTYIVLVVLLLIVLICSIMAWLLHGEIREGDHVHIYINGKYNRTATVFAVSQDGIGIYDGHLFIPVGWNMGFYTIGYNEDRDKYVCMRNRGEYLFYVVSEALETMKGGRRG